MVMEKGEHSGGQLDHVDDDHGDDYVDSDQVDEDHVDDDHVDNDRVDGDQPGWQKLYEYTKGLRRKVLTRTKILSPNICYLVGILRFVAIYALDGDYVDDDIFHVDSNVDEGKFEL